MVKIHYFHFNPYIERCMVIWNDGPAAVILDPGCESQGEKDRLFSFIEDNGLKPVAILLTHAHFDHIYGVKDCIEHYSIPVYMHPDDKVLLNNMAEFMGAFPPYNIPDTDFPTIDIHDTERLFLAGMEFEVMHTPGHSPGSVCFYLEDGLHLFSGDTLFAGTIGRCDHKWGDYDKEIVSIMDKIMGLEGDIKVHPCHGGGTTIAYERTHNPFLQPFNEKYSDGSVDGIEFNG